MSDQHTFDSAVEELMKAGDFDRATAERVVNNARKFFGIAEPPVLKTPEEKAAFSKEWDRRYEIGSARRAGKTAKQEHDSQCGLLAYHPGVVCTCGGEAQESSTTHS